MFKLWFIVNEQWKVLSCFVVYTSMTTGLYSTNRIQNPSKKSSLSYKTWFLHSVFGLPRITCGESSHEFISSSALCLSIFIKHYFPRHCLYHCVLLTITLGVTFLFIFLQSRSDLANHEHRKYFFKQKLHVLLQLCSRGQYDRSMAANQRQRPLRPPPNICSHSYEAM